MPLLALGTLSEAQTSYFVEDIVEKTSGFTDTLGYATAVDAENCVHIGMVGYTDSSSSATTETKTILVGSDGQIDWTATYNSLGTGEYYTKNIAVGPDCQTYVVGLFRDSIYSTSAPYTPFVVAYDSTGTELWDWVDNDGAASLSGYFFAKGRALSMRVGADIVTSQQTGSGGPAGKVYVCYDSASARMVVRSLDRSNGSEVFTYRYDGPTGWKTEPHKISLREGQAAGTTAKLYLSGTTDTTNSTLDATKAVTVQIDAENGSSTLGQADWVHEMDANAGLGVQANDEYILAIHLTDSAQKLGARVVQFDTAGSVNWSSTYIPTASSGLGIIPNYSELSEPTSTSGLNHEALYLTAYEFSTITELETRNSQLKFSPWVSASAYVLAFDPSSGNLLWDDAYNAEDNKEDYPTGLSYLPPDTAGGKHRLFVSAGANANNLLFFGGDLQGADSSDAHLLQYDAETGTLDDAYIHRTEDPINWGTDVIAYRPDSSAFSGVKYFATMVGMHLDSGGLDPQTQLDIVRYAEVDPSNPNNPLDSVGIVHNAVLDTVLHNFDLLVIDTNSCGVRTLTDESFLNVSLDKWNYNSENDSIYNRLITSKYQMEKTSEPLIDDSASRIFGFYTESQNIDSSSALEYEYIDSVVYDQSVNKPLTFSMETLNSRINNYQDSSSDVDSSLLGTYSTLNYSTAYWANDNIVLENGSSEFNTWNSTSNHYDRSDERENANYSLDCPPNPKSAHCNLIQGAIDAVVYSLWADKGPGPGGNALTQQWESAARTSASRLSALASENYDSESYSPIR